MKQRQNGMAVITAILVVALVASAASFMAWQQQLWVRQVENLNQQAQSRVVALAAMQWARSILAQDSRNNQVDHLEEGWAQALAPLPVEGGELAGGLTDQQGLFNLNSLVRAGKTSATDLAVFRKLLDLLQLSPELAAAVIDWIDPDAEVTYPGGAEDMDYLALDPPYRAGNRVLTTVDGLYRIKGFDAATVERLRPFVTALPQATPINVNTAPAEVLAAAIAELPLDQAQALVTARKGKHFKDIADFRARLPKTVTQMSETLLSVSSRYFLVAGHAHFGRAKVGYQALLEREATAWPKLVWLKNI
jgi:general secretion pathway protein K